MRRIGRWMLNALTALSLLLCVGTVGLWVVALAVRHPIVSSHRASAAGTWWVGLRAGEMFWHEEAAATTQVWVTSTYVNGKPVPVTGPVPVLTNTAIPYTSRSERVFPGITVSGSGISIPMSYGPPSWQGSSREVTIKLWLPCLLFALLPSPRIALYVRGARRKSGTCRNCRYDLTGNVSGVCPECGMKISGVL